MLEDEIITQRLEEMKCHRDPSDSLWPENCEGSRRALVIFVGPSPGGEKKDDRHKIIPDCKKPLWNETYNEPLSWSPGFQKSFKPIVEAIFLGKPYEESAKLIARFNMDWMGNPESQDVSYPYMWEGCKYILPVLEECDPELVIPMDEKTFVVLQLVLANNNYEIMPARIGKFKIEIPTVNGDPRYHHGIMAFSAKKLERSFVVIKSLQHPARIFNIDYAKRVGQAIRDAANQIWKCGT